MMKRWMFLLSLVVFLAVTSSVGNAGEEGEGYITGKFQPKNGESMSGGRISFFDIAAGPKPLTGEYWRLPDYIFPIGEDGSFTVPLPAGTYYVMAVKKPVGKRFGPPAEGDLIYPALDVKEQKPYAVRSNETTDLGDLEAVPFRKEWAASGENGIEGSVRDMNGKPVERKLVVASGSASLERPLYVSDGRTGKNGGYIVRVPEGGTYYVRVMGYSQPVVPVTVKTGEMTKGIDIVLTKKPESQGLGEKEGQ
jgi:hypothetical protein